MKSKLVRELNVPITGGVVSNFSSYNSKILLKLAPGFKSGHLDNANEAAVLMEVDPG